MTAMKRKISVLLTLLLGISLYAQSADVITDLLESEKATFGQVCYLAGVQQDIISEDTSYENAVQVLYEKGIIPNSEDPQAPIPLVDIAYIYSRLWPIQGGLMFRLTKGSPRYAFKQLKTDGIISDDADPNSFVSGREALNILTACMMEYGTDESMEMEIE